jgi:hypothetical protein
MEEPKDKDGGNPDLSREESVLGHGYSDVPQKELSMSDSKD